MIAAANPAKDAAALKAARKYVTRRDDCFSDSMEYQADRAR